MRVLELGQFISISYAGMLLAEQGCEVTKWTAPDGRPDPVQDLLYGGELWAWLCQGKRLVRRAAAEVATLPPGEADVVLDNFRADAWTRWQVDPAEQAARLGVPWVSLRDEFDQRSFDPIAQARAWGDLIGCVPACLGDTAAGLWMAFKALAAPPGHHVLRQGSILAKLVEGELLVDPPRPHPGLVPWMEPGSYGPDIDGGGDGVIVMYRGEPHREPYRDSRWRREHLDHRGGRYVI
jgi:CoA-transferase family III